MDDLIKIGENTFRFNEKENSYTEVINVNGEKILIKNYDLDNIKKSLLMTSKLIKNLDINSLKEFIARCTYDKESEDLGITRSEFIEAIDLDVITIDGKYIEYWFNDGEIYGGHSIVLTNKIGEEKITIDFAG